MAPIVPPMPPMNDSFGNSTVHASSANTVPISNEDEMQDGESEEKDEEA